MWRGKSGVYVKFFVSALHSLIFMLAWCPGWSAELRWDGEANDGLWQNPLNWSSNSLPGPSDDLVFDNSLINSAYTVNLGSGAGAIVIRSLRITPSGSNIITLVIASTNLESPALSCSGSVYGLVLDPGAVFINESGASSGSTIEVTDSIRINNGGRYVHRTPRSHAETVRSLSRAPGTEQGEFEFSIPVASSTISLSGQVFGKLRLSPGPTGLINYTGTGTNGLTIRSHCLIMPGVNLSLNLEGRLLIGGDLLHNGGILNLASTARKLIMELGGNFHQSAAAITTESGTSQPEIILKGNQLQELGIAGNITNEVSLEINNLAGARLTHDLSLPYKLILKNGILSTNDHLVILQSSCQLDIDGASDNCFVNGKISKKGLVKASFQFPVGKNATRRWVKLHEATGDFVAEYMRSDPRMLSPDLGAGIAHISGLEHWSISGAGPGAAARVELSFDHVNSGGVTDLSDLRVAWLDGQSWQDGGNSATTGTAGSNGSVSSNMQTWAGTQPIFYTLASNTTTENALPIIWKSFSVAFFGRMIRLEWITDSESVAYYKVEKSTNGSSFITRDVVRARNGSRVNQYTDVVDDSHMSPRNIPLFYRVVMVKHDSSQSISKIIRVGSGWGIWRNSLDSRNARAFLSTSVLKIDFQVPVNELYFLVIVDISGRLIYKGKIEVKQGKSLLPLYLPVASGTTLFVHLRDNNGNTVVIKVMKQK
ncbi:hypothetical protein ACX0G7_14065 [Flavitalea antarctica]